MWPADVRDGFGPGATNKTNACSSMGENRLADSNEEVDRAIDNLVKSGKIFNGVPRRESFPLMTGRPYDHGRCGPASSRPNDS